MLGARFLLALTLFGVNAFAQSSSPAPAPTGNRITILYDAFGKNASLKPDWGYSALVEFEGKRILFDTGNNARIFEANAKSLGVDLTRLDFVVISHRHGDHTSGLKYLLSVNPEIAVYAPTDEPFRDSTPAAFFTQAPDASLPPEMRYFGGNIPSSRCQSHGIAWPGAHIHNCRPFSGYHEPHSSDQHGRGNSRLSRYARSVSRARHSARTDCYSRVLASGDRKHVAKSRPANS